MPEINFSQYYYFPCLQCSDAEQIGYRYLDADDKAAILPIFEVSQIKNEAPFEDSVSAIAESAGDQLFLLDLSKDRAPPAFKPKDNADEQKIKRTQAAQDEYNSALMALLKADDGFAAWRGLVASFPNAIPMLQFTDPGTQSKNILRQAAQFNMAGWTHMAIRITEGTSEDLFPVIGQITAVLDSASQLLIVIDCGSGRQRIAERAEFAKKAIARIAKEMDPERAVELVAVCVAESFPSPNHTALKQYDSCSWDIWEQASETYPFLFGDYGAHRRLKKPTTYMPGDWKAVVTYPLPKGWMVYRHQNSQDADGWIEGAKVIVAALKEDHAYEDEGSLPDCWGSTLIVMAESGTIDGVGSARFWHGAKINMHIHRQIRYAKEIMGGSEEF